MWLPASIHRSRHQEHATPSAALPAAFRASHDSAPGREGGVAATVGRGTQGVDAVQITLGRGAERGGEVPGTPALGGEWSERGGAGVARRGVASGRPTGELRGSQSRAHDLFRELRAEQERLRDDFAAQLRDMWREAWDAQVEKEQALQV